MPDGDAGDQSFFVWWHGGDPAASLEMHSVRPEIIEAIRALHRMASIGTAGFRCRPPRKQCGNTTPVPADTENNCCTSVSYVAIGKLAVEAARLNISNFKESRVHENDATGRLTSFLTSTIQRHPRHVRLNCGSSNHSL